MCDRVVERGSVDAVGHRGMGDRVREIMGHSVDSVGCVDGDGERLAVLVNRDGLGEEGVQQRVGIKGVQLGGRVAVNCVPGLASEEFLIKQSSVRTHESCSRGAVSSILAHAVSLTP